MGLNLSPIIVKHVTSLEGLSGRVFAVDAFNVLHQFLALIRTRSGRPLTGPDGRVTSHLVGLVFRSTRLISDFGMKLVFVFDGNPPDLKKNTIEARKKAKIKAEKEYEKALETGDMGKVWSKAVQTGRLSLGEVQDTKRLLSLLGIPWVQAPSEGEAQAAFMVKRGDVWAVNSRDYDSLIFGAPRLARYLTIQGEKWLPSQGRSRKLRPELMGLEENLRLMKLNLRQLVDVCILIGTDFNTGVKGIGPKTALKMIQKHKRLEELPKEIREKLPKSMEAIRKIYLDPNVTDDYTVNFTSMKESELYRFLVDERGFNSKRVETIVKRINHAQRQTNLMKWVEE